MHKLGMQDFKHTVQSAKRFGIGFELLDLLAAPPLIGTPWGVRVETITKDPVWGGELGNGPGPGNPSQFPDGVGDCVIADNLRKVRSWNALGKGKIIPITTADAFALYSAETGFNVNNPNSDQGADPITNANYLENTGWKDDQGVLHKVDAWVAIDQTNDNHIKNAMNLLGPVSYCMDFPDFAMTQFDAGQPWDYTGQSYTSEGGHDILAVQYERATWADGIHDLKDIVTWGKRIQSTHRFWQQFLVGVIAWISLDFIAANGNFPSGINIDQAVKDLQALKA